MNRKLCYGSLLLLLFLAGVEAGGWAQRRQGPSPPPPEPADNNPPNSTSRRLKMMKESFEQTQKDTAHLYDLAAELKQEMENANEDVLSLMVMKKAETIEKLAEKIKNRMKNL